MELWKDGLLISVGPGDESYLAWSFQSKPEEPIFINNFVLAEMLLVFCWLTQIIFFDADPKPNIIRVAAGFDNMSRAEKPALLSDVPSGGMGGLMPPKQARASKLEVEALVVFREVRPRENRVRAASRYLQLVRVRVKRRSLYRP